MKTVVLAEGTLRYFETEKGFHAEDESGKRLAEIEIRKVPGTENTFDICRTFVDDALRGRGIAGRLTALAVSRIEKNGGTVQASCSYGQHWLSSHKKDQ